MTDQTKLTNTKSRRKWLIVACAALAAVAAVVATCLLFGDDLLRMLRPRTKEMNVQGIRLVAADSETDLGNLAIERINPSSLKSLNIDLGAASEAGFFDSHCLLVEAETGNLYLHKDTRVLQIRWLRGGDLELTGKLGMFTDKASRVRPISGSVPGRDSQGGSQVFVIPAWTSELSVRMTPRTQ